MHDKIYLSSLTPLANKAHRQKTSTKKRTLNPEFNEVGWPNFYMMN